MTPFFQPRSFSPAACFWRRRGFSLLEVAGVLVLAGFLLSMTVMALGNSQDRALRERVSSDLSIFTLAKAQWRAQNPTAIFPSTESARFTAISPFLASLGAPAASLSAMEPSGVVYTIGAENVAPSATKGGLTFDPILETFH